VADVAVEAAEVLLLVVTVVVRLLVGAEVVAVVEAAQLQEVNTRVLTSAQVHTLLKV